MSQETFTKLKPSCVLLLQHASLQPASIPIVVSSLADVTSILQETKSSGQHLPSSITNYVFFPLSTTLRRNVQSQIPDRVLEGILCVFALLCDPWWWDMDGSTWEQLFMLAGTVLGGMDAKGKGKERDAETKQAAASCLYSLLRERDPSEDPAPSQTTPSRSVKINLKFIAFAQTVKFIPILGQTVNHLLATAESPHRPLQKLSLDLLHIILKDYLPDDIIPSILPGVVSNMSKLALGKKESKGWANGDIVASSLLVMQVTIVRSIGDDVCVGDGVVRDIQDLEDLTNIAFDEQPKDPPSQPSRYSTLRTSAWLRATASQLHIALNSLHPLMTHPTPSALSALATFSEEVLSKTSSTLQQSQVLLLTFLLSVTTSSFDSVSSHAKACLKKLLSPSSRTSHELFQTLIQLSRDYLASLSRLIQRQADSKIEHTAKIIEAICNLASEDDDIDRPAAMSALSAGAGKLLGPTGGIEKWGWSLLSVLEFTIPSVSVNTTSISQLIEGSEPSGDRVYFPGMSLRHLPNRSTYEALERMYRSLGRAAGDDGLYATEWFVSIGQRGPSSRGVTAMWCAARLLEGASRISLSEPLSDAIIPTSSKRLARFSRGLAKSIAEQWDVDAEVDPTERSPDESSSLVDEDEISIQHRTGLIPIKGVVGQRATFPSSFSATPPRYQLELHKATILQVLAISSGILQAKFTVLLLHALYPVLQSLVSSEPFLAGSAAATLRYFAIAMSYATPANLLLSNFDYALDAISRRLSRRWLDVDATKILALLVRLVGRDIVQRAGDVVEECFDRLDEYHGYQVIVDGLVTVLSEVVNAVASDDNNRSSAPPALPAGDQLSQDTGEEVTRFLEWFSHRADATGQAEAEAEGEDFSAVPQEAWGVHDNKSHDKNVDGEQDGGGYRAEDPTAEPPPTPTQELTKQIVSRSMYFLTHGSPPVRAQILNLLGSASAVLPESAIMPSIHHAWPFILNRLTDPEAFVVSAAARLVESLVTHVGDLMYRRIWDDIWPRFRTILAKLEAADATNALSRRGYGAVGTESAYTHSHRLYRSLIVTMTAAVKGVQAQDAAIWEVIIAFRRFLHQSAHEELQACARKLYKAIARGNEDAVWFALCSTQGGVSSWPSFYERRWDVAHNTKLILGEHV